MEEEEETFSPLWLRHQQPNTPCCRLRHSTSSLLFSSNAFVLLLLAIALVFVFVNTVSLKMQHFICVAIYSNQVLVNKVEVMLFTGVGFQNIKKKERLQGLTFRGHDESENSNNQSNFLQLLQFLTDHNEEVRIVALKNALRNLKFTSPRIQNDIVNAVFVETTNSIIKNIGDAFFSFLVHESRDVAVKEQMDVTFHYVDKNECVIEYFTGIEHVPSTTAMSLKRAINAVLSKHGLSISRLRDQGYDGASNMSGTQRIFFDKNKLSKLLRHFKLENLQVDKDLIRVLKSIDVLDEIAYDKHKSDQKHEAYISLKLLQSFDYIFSLHLMRIILGITHELSQALQRDDKDIVNAMELVKVCKGRLQTKRESGWSSLLEEVVILCGKVNVRIPNMDDQYVYPGKSRRTAPEMTNMHYYQFDFFSYDKQSLMRLAQLYPNDFSSSESLLLENQLETYIEDMRSNENFQELLLASFVKEKGKWEDFRENPPQRETRDKRQETRDRRETQNTNKISVPPQSSL
ncbi:uncharacterized protein LOC126802388 [Argentina anserina]|uniref:uncharacterized protein LOC126802388 n=1 Tax=Argentina anserina TaxID=57926 RepID=UPI0021765DFF|nr:uncharacterized protein LOC126802388 [Potentilla anserina]